MLRESRDRQVEIHAGKCVRRDSRARFHQHFEPETEAIGVEQIVQTRLGRAPQIEIEDRRQLTGCRQRHELAAILESAVLYDAVQQFRGQARDDVREVRRVENPHEQRTRVLDGALRKAVALLVRRETTRMPNGLWFHSTSRNKLRSAGWQKRAGPQI